MTVECVKCQAQAQGKYAALLREGWTNKVVKGNDIWTCPRDSHPAAQPRVLRDVPPHWRTSE